MKKYRFVKIVLLIVFLLFIVIAVSFGKIYFDVKKTLNQSYEKVERKGKYKYKAIHLSQQPDEEKLSPLNILLLGIDTGDLGRIDQGRSDALILATINPKNKTVLFTSIARDTYTEIVGYGSTDKINHAYAFGGTSMSVNTVSNLLDTPVDYYVSLNMKGVEELIDAVGGITINNPLKFEYEGETFKIGDTYLDGTKGLKYIRMRYDDPEGDYGRQKRERQVVQGIANSLKSINNFTLYQKILEILGENMKTNIAMDDIFKLYTKYLGSINTQNSEQLMGTGFMLNDISYQKVSDAELKRVRDKIHRELENR
ncbi:hypothetical protein RV11_GL003205 [Enterococcus phoeniculicola]|uniref:Cell envelope-related transcriptional attenuator domain-containing protein n=1 Tax=Enterococcus phoeniculicola ATCC BAA-412 TaxID=1158610 RepID=R3W5R8_9ENTE|nr:LCP family protein [Enterococcus phoeniculicola]EOL42976.1 hypothetical protein UC3_01953 [Enterococcus phoeniculicola ATCC BAA-412]EOT76666.1 hypothetical protein I589_01623 [Enterococcus phoeniculicola ATCC BAA-412]OJG72234.1 hypothetical protein RV11_GL003205 [Enterococcus phoeniculicola]